MENAGKSVADVIATRFGADSSVVVYSGTGRNGGDGMVVARHLAGKNFKVTLRLVGNSTAISDPIILQNWRALKSMTESVKIEECRDSSTLARTRSDVLVDAVLGTGVHSKLRQPQLRAVQAMNESGGFKVAVDVPTGIDSDSGEVLGEAVGANLTVTFHATKPGLKKASPFCGEVAVVDIGIPPEASMFAGPGDVEAVRTLRPLASHKGQNGRLLVIGGNETFTGAPAFVAMAAYRTGVDLVFIAAPEKVAVAIATMSPNLITVSLPGKNLTTKHVAILRGHVEKASAVAVGPGLGKDAKTAAVVQKILTLVGELKKPLLVDADGLNALGIIRKRVFHRQTVLTPHAEEFQVIAGRAPSKDLPTRENEVKTTAAKSGAVTLLKGQMDVISDGDQVKLNRTGNPGMTVGGTGDVLSGIISGLLAQGIDGFRAAVAGAFISGAAGDLAEAQLGYHLVPTDLLDQIPRVMNDPMCHKPIYEKRLR